MSYNKYQQLHHDSLYGKTKPTKPKQYALYYNGSPGEPAPYALLQHMRNERIRNGTPAYLLKIKPIKQ